MPLLFCEIIDLIHDTRLLCTRSRIDGIKAMSRGISGVFLPIRVIPVEFVYSIKTRRQNVHIEFWQDLRHYCLP